MEIKLYFAMLKRGWLLIFLTAMTALAVSLLLSYAATPQYQAAARFMISPSASLTSGPDVVRSLDTLDRPSVVATYAEIMNSNRIFVSACQFLNLDSTALAEIYTVQAVVLPESSVLELTVSGPDPDLVAILANSVGQQTISFTRSLNQVYDLNILDSALVPELPFSPEPVRDAIVALVVGLAAGAVLAILSEQLRSPIESYRNRLRTDSVTGLFNANYFTRLLEQELGQNPDDPLSIGLVELNGLSDYLGTLPPAGLQALLVKVKEIFTRELRGHDTIARWSDVSFSVMLPTTAGPAANRTFDRINQALRQPVDLPSYGVSVNLDPKIGGAVYSDHITAQELLDKANASLERARRDNANPIYVWELKSPFWVQAEAKK